MPDDGIDENCDGAEAVDPTAGVVDADGDGHSQPADCNDGNAKIKPGAHEIPGDTVDENCDTMVAPFSLTKASLTAPFAASSDRQCPHGADGLLSFPGVEHEQVSPPA